MGMSKTKFKEKDLKVFGRISFQILWKLKLLHVETSIIDGEKFIECNNLTLINLTLKFLGPMHEESLTKILLIIQVFYMFFISILNLR